ncbi:MAG: hypothetical protein HYZ28_12830 [Myxococcales bacterium]|nr:hypothetical protein [Myxococcales bacterium]
MPFGLSLSPLTFEALHATAGTVRLTLRSATPADADTWEQVWKPALAGGPTAGWPWREHIERAVAAEGFLCLSIVRPGRLEALASLTIESWGSRLEPGAPILYIEYLGVAPDHLGPPIGTRAIRGLGGVLTDQAVRLADRLGFHGRVGLHSKREVEDFYARKGFTAVARESTPDGHWLYFEMTPHEARRIVEGA